MQPHTRDAWQASRFAPNNVAGAACIAPWVSLEFDPTGLVFSCCASQSYPVGRIGEHRLRDIWNGPRVSVLREAMVKWDLSVACASCRWHLETGRMDPDAAVYDRYQLASPSPELPAAMTFALTNQCNLACVMCSGDLSSTIRKNQGLEPLRNPYDEQFFDDLEPLTKGLQYVRFLGGEPLLIASHERVLDMLVTNDVRPGLHITTNGTIYNKRVEWIFEHFATDITVSIDGVSAETYELIRGGSDFDRVIGNITQFRERTREMGTELRFCFCLMNNNAHELVRFYRWADSLDAAVTINVVSNTGLALHDEPLEVLQRIDEAWRTQAGDLELQRQDLRDSLATQRTQLRHVIESHETNVALPSKVPTEATPGFLAAPELEIVPQRILFEESDALTRWSTANDVATLFLDNDVIVAAEGAIERLVGLGCEVVGATPDEFLSHIAQHDGRRLWMFEHDDQPRRSVRSVICSQRAPVRGVSGTIIRLVRIRLGARDALLVGIDEIYNR